MIFLFILKLAYINFLNCTELIEDQLVGLQSRIVSGEEEMRSHLAVDIDHRIKEWQQKSQDQLFDKLKETLTNHIVR